MKQVTENIYQVGLGIVNVFLVEDSTGLTLVDTGVKGSTDKIFAAIKKGGKNPEDIKRIILTHAHPDHSGSAAEIKRRLNIPVLSHPIDAAIMANGIGGREKNLSPGIANWIIYQLFIKKTPNTIDAVTTDQLINDNDILPIAGGMRVIHTPGHCAGHVSLLVPQENVLIAGDICANAAGIDLSTVYEDRALGIKSILKAAAFNFDKAVFGHGSVLEHDASKKIGDKFRSM